MQISEKTNKIFSYYGNTYFLSLPTLLNTTLHPVAPCSQAKCKHLLYLNRDLNSRVSDLISEWVCPVCAKDLPHWKKCCLDTRVTAQQATLPGVLRAAQRLACRSSRTWPRELSGETEVGSGPWHSWWLLGNPWSWMTSYLIKMLPSPSCVTTMIPRNCKRLMISFELPLVLNIQSLW